MDHPGFDSRQEKKFISSPHLHQNVQTGTGSHPASYLVTGYSLSGGQAMGRGADHHSHPPMRLPMSGVIPLLHLYGFVACKRQNFTFSISLHACRYYIEMSSWQFDVGKSVHLHKFKWINQLDATVSRVYYLTFSGSTCFGRLHAHHQELTTALAASGFTVGAWW